MYVFNSGVYRKTTYGKWFDITKYFCTTTYNSNNPKASESFMSGYSLKICAINRNDNNDCRIYVCSCVCVCVCVAVQLTCACYEIENFNDSLRSAIYTRHKLTANTATIGLAISV